MALLRKLRDIAARPVFAESGFGFLVAGDVIVLMDATDRVYTEAPGMMSAVIVVVVFAMTGLAFRSCLIPLRLLLTVAVTLVFVVGVIKVAFQDILGLDGVYWLIPISTAPLVVGLTIDYDVFLISRVHETRMRGTSTQIAVLEAMSSQSNIITTAGVIMTIAFGSLLLSSVTVLNQVSKGRRGALSCVRVCGGTWACFCFCCGWCTVCYLAVGLLTDGDAWYYCSVHPPRLCNFLAVWAYFSHGLDSGHIPCSGVSRSGASVFRSREQLVARKTARDHFSGPRRLHTAAGECVEESVVRTI